MRVLYILRGCPGSGKSTWVKKNQLEPYTLSPDDIRLEYQSPVFDIHGSLSISQRNDRLVWQRLRECLEQRMERGEFTIVDATHYSHDLLNQYRALIEKYRYRAYIVDFTGVPIETILKQNRKREGYKFVPEDRIYYICDVIASRQKISNRYKVMAPEEAVDMLHAPLAIDWNGRYERIAVFGDIHGCFEPLQEYFSRFPYDEHTLYVFTGDYIDRGIQNKEVLQFFIDNLDKKNFLFLEGNHERRLRLYSDAAMPMVSVFRNRELPFPPEFFHTMNEIRDISRKDIRRFCSRLSQMAYARFGSKTYCITHGGIPVAPSIFMASSQMIKGVGQYEELDAVYAAWKQNTPDDHVLIHGHRNLYELAPRVDDRIYNLCSPIELGGALRVLHIGPDDHIEVMEFPNRIYRLPEKPSAPFVPKSDEEWLRLLDSSKLIMKKDLSDGVSSYNFTRDAFKSRQWNMLTCKARGLFVKDGRVICRSYDKFFNVGELPETEIQNLHKRFAFPVSVFRKYNGFLGLLAADPDSDGLMYCSKSSTDSPHVDFLKKVVGHLGLDTEAMAAYCRDHEATLVCECIDPVNDSHIVPYDEEHLVLLDIIRNSFVTEKLPYSEVKAVAGKLGMECKQLEGTLDRFSQFTEICRHIDTPLEGYVFEDANGFMVKLKSPSYKFWKMMRGVKKCMEDGRSYGWYVARDEWKPYYIEALKVMQKLCQQPGELEKHSIIDIRRAVEQKMQSN